MKKKEEMRRIAEAIEKESGMLVRMMEILEEEHALSKKREAEQTALHTKLYKEWDERVKEMADAAKAKLMEELPHHKKDDEEDPYM